jgi:endo-1,4-beta-xylanase
MKSTGAQDGAGWILDKPGFVGTYISVPKDGLVTIGVHATGSGATLGIVVADTIGRFELGPESKSFATRANLPAGTYLLSIQLCSGSKLTIEDVSVNGGDFLNKSDDATALFAADCYVANFRKGPATLSIAGATPGQSVHVKLRRHAFNFGTVIPNSFNDTVLTDNPEPDSDAYRYQAFIKDWFNTVVPGNAGKWVSNEKTQGEVKMEFVDHIIDFAHQNHLRIRMHNLIWGNQQPDYVNALLARAKTGGEQAKKELRAAITARIKYYVRDRTANYIDMDVLNEVMHTQPYLKIFGIDGIADIYKETADAVKAANATTRLYTNEYNVLQWSHQIDSNGKETSDDPYANWYLDNTLALMHAGAPVGGIGVQYYADLKDPATRHCPHSPARIAGAIANLAVAGLPITLTEFGMQRGHETSYDQSLPPKIIGETMRMMFGTPQVDGFLVWGFRKPWLWEQADAGALLDENWQPTAAGKVFEDLMKQWTTELTATVGTDGKVQFSGFYGDYDLSFGGRKMAFSLVKGTTSYDVK